MNKKEEFTYEFNPIKEAKEGSAVIWTTNAIHKALDAINKGLPLKANPFVGKMTKLLRTDIVYKRNKDEIDDYIKSKSDILYFAEKCFLMTPEGLQTVKLRDYQIKYLKQLQENRFNILLSARQSGKSVTTAIFALWVVLFNNDKNGLILSKSAQAGRDLLAKVKDMYMYLPYHLKAGVMKWNQSEISFDNNSILTTEAFSETSGLGSTRNFVILDECAWMNPNIFDIFYSNVIPTITSMPDSRICIMSTQNGRNHFYKLWEDAIVGKSDYKAIRVDWDQVPEYNIETKKWEKRTEKWKNQMIGILGSEESFYYQYGTQFISSDKCLISRETISQLHKNEELFKKIETDMYFYGIENLYIKPNYDLDKFKTNFYIILVDIAEGSGGDFTVFNIMELLDNNKFEQIGYWKSNIVPLEDAALQLWCMEGKLFTPNHLIISIEFNTYGSLFIKHLYDLNEEELYPESSFRFKERITSDEFPVDIIVSYKKANQDEERVQMVKKKSNIWIPGIRWNSSNKKVACKILKIMIENGDIIITDLQTIYEFESFERVTDYSDTYKAAYGHDDLVMTLVQIPFLKDTPKYKEFYDDYEINKIAKNKLKVDNSSGTIYDIII